MIIAIYILASIFGLIGFCSFVYALVLTTKDLSTKIVKSKPKPIINTTEFKPKNFDILYDEAKGHVFTVEIDGKTNYFVKQRIRQSDAQVYVQRKLWKLENEYISNYRKYNYDYDKYIGHNMADVYASEEYKNLSDEPNIKNILPNDHSMYVLRYYTTDIDKANRFKDKSLSVLERLIEESHTKVWKSLAEDDLLKLSIINETETTRERYFDFLAEKYMEKAFS